MNFLYLQIIHPKQKQNTGCVRKKKLYNFQFLIAGKLNKAQQQHSCGQNLIFLCVRSFLSGIIPWSGVKVMVH